MSLGGDGERSRASSIGIQGQVRWAGFRALSDTQVETLAKAIVAEIRRRGAEDQAPALSIAEFVNRRVGAPTGLHVLSGLLETAIKAKKSQSELTSRANQNFGRRFMVTSFRWPDADEI